MLVFSAKQSYQTDDYIEIPTWDCETGFGDHFDYGNYGSEVDESNELVSQPRQVCFFTSLVSFQLSDLQVWRF